MKINIKIRTKNEKAYRRKRELRNKTAEQRG